MTRYSLLDGERRVVRGAAGPATHRPSLLRDVGHCLNRIQAWHLTLALVSLEETADSKHGLLNVILSNVSYRDSV